MYYSKPPRMPEAINHKPRSGRLPVLGLALLAAEYYSDAPVRDNAGGNRRVLPYERLACPAKVPAERYGFSDRARRSVQAKSRALN